MMSAPLLNVECGGIEFSMVFVFIFLGGLSYRTFPVNLWFIFVLYFNAFCLAIINFKGFWACFYP